MKKNRITAASILLVTSMILGGCSLDSSLSSEKSDKQEKVTVTATTKPIAIEETPDAPATDETTEAAEAPTEVEMEIKVIITKTAYQCENIGVTVDELMTKYVNEPEYGMFAEPPRKSYNFGDGVFYGGNERIEIITYPSYTGEILPDLKLGMSFDEISENYSLSEPDTANLYGTYCSYIRVKLNGKEITVNVDFGDDADCTSASFCWVTES